MIALEGFGKAIGETWLLQGVISVKIIVILSLVDLSKLANSGRAGFDEELIQNPLPHYSQVCLTKGRRRRDSGRGAFVFETRRKKGKRRKTDELPSFFYCLNEFP